MEAFHHQHQTPESREIVNQRTNPVDSLRHDTVVCKWFFQCKVCGKCVRRIIEFYRNSREGHVHGGNASKNLRNAAGTGSRPWRKLLKECCWHTDKDGDYIHVYIKLFFVKQHSTNQLSFKQFLRFTGPESAQKPYSVDFRLICKLAFSRHNF